MIEFLPRARDEFCHAGVSLSRRGGDATFNAEVAHSLLAGESGAVRDAVLLNSAAALVAFDGPGEDLLGALARGLERAAAAVDSGDAAALLTRWAALTAELGPD